MYVISANSLHKDIPCDDVVEALVKTVNLALKLKENITLFQGKNKEKVLALVRGQEIKEGE